MTQQAAEWVDELRESGEKRAEFFDWLLASPRHVEETLFVLAMAREAAAVPAGEREALAEEVQQAAGTEAVNVVPLAASCAASIPRLQADRSWMERQRSRLGMAAATVLAVGLTWLALNYPGANEYSTGPGEHRTVVLDDGSLIELNTRSRLRVEYSPEARKLRLLRGETLFTVQRDPQRPFSVETGDTVIEALGTQFNVYRRPGDTRVSVLEGLVQVSGRTNGTGKPPAARVPAGQEVTVTEGRISDPSPLDATKTMAWRQRRLVFEDDTLATIVAEFNRYTAKIEIQVEADVAQERFTGAFDADTPERFLAAVAANPLLTVSRQGDRILIRGR